jgi:radical SAM protein with 4Fe4S-binding SPASM domain
MPNVLFTQSCTRSCPYCFAKKHMADSAPTDILSWENLIYLADFFELSGEKHFQILGGEPTLHPDFNDMVAYLLERGFFINVFTNGIMSDEKLFEAVTIFKGISAEKFSFTINLNEPNATPQSLAESESIKRFLNSFCDRITPGFNIYREDFDPTFIFRLINEHGLNRTIRIGLAHPIAGKRNIYIKPASIEKIITRLFQFRPIMERLRIRPALDCGFPMCKFSTEQLGWLYRHIGGHYPFGCASVIDIGPDMSIWSCFPLSDFHKKSIFEFNNIEEIHRYYNDIRSKIRVEAGGIYNECDNCILREENSCKGGCLAHSLNNFYKEHHLRMKEMYI